MEVLLTPDLQARLSQIAAHQGRAKEALVVESVEHPVSYDGCSSAKFRRAWRPPIAENSQITMKSGS
jgi:predicted transcriptional regulator